MTNELTVRVERPVIPAMNWNKDEVPPIQAVSTRLNPSRMPKPTVLPSTSGTSS